MIQHTLYCTTYVLYLRCDINKTCVCLPLGLFYITTPVSTITLMVVHIYLTLSITSQHTSFPMLTTAPLDRASLVPSNRPSLEDFNSKVS